MTDAISTPPSTRLIATPSETELAALAAYLQAVTEREKHQLARTLHDDLGGLLTAAKMDLSWLQSRLDTPMIQDRLAQLGAVLDEAMDLKRRVVEQLRPSLLEHFGLPTTLRTYFDATCSQARLVCEVDIADEAQTLPHDTAIAVFRIVQAGLDNVIRHARATRVRLVLTANPEGFVVLLSDDGRGFDAQDQRLGGSPGLAGMRQRARTLGGQCDIDSAAGSGTRLRLSVPA
ncbi:MAG TPA: sensor histidine kinase [Steroidobacteraceae bacterium]|jgi:signal transduction histidine kinase